MDLLETGTRLLVDRLGARTRPQSVAAALESLLGGADGHIDLARVVTRMMGNDELRGLASSWLGDGANDPISAGQIEDVLGSVHVTAFASRLGIDTCSAGEALAELMPVLIDRASRDGFLLDGDGTTAGLLGAARAFL